MEYIVFFEVRTKSLYVMLINNGLQTAKRSREWLSLFEWISIYEKKIQKKDILHNNSEGTYFLKFKCLQK